MTAVRTRSDVATAPNANATPAPRRWLLFVHQLPSEPSNLRVKTWRRMQQIGAMAIKQAVYVLPDSPNAREDFEWLKTEVESAGGDVHIFSADSIDTWSDDALVEEFRRSRQEAYAGIAADVETVLNAASKRGSRKKVRSQSSRRTIESFRQRVNAVASLDFFGSAGRDRVVSLLDRLEANASGQRFASPKDAAQGGRSRDAYRGRLWVTRPRPGVDRMSSAWLIQRFIDADARFDFVADRDAAPRDSLPFDMFGVELSHQGEHCTFETLVEMFGITDAAVGRIAAIVHDLDLKDARFGAPEAPAIGMVIDGLQLTHADDHVLLTHGIELFESLYRTFQQASRPSRPTPVARRRKKTARSSRR